MHQALHILIVEDSEDDSMLLVRELRRNGYDPYVERVETAVAMTQALDRQSWDVVLSDYSMPHFSAPAALALLKERGLDLPFIIVSGTIGEESAVMALKSGAHDFIVKGRLARLLPAIERELREAEVRRARQQAELALHKSEERFRRLADYAPDIIYRYRLAPTPGFDYISPAVTAITGYTPAEHYADPALNLKQVHPDDRFHLEAVLQNPVAITTPLMLRWVRKDGTVIWTEHRIVSIPDMAGNVIAIEGIARDITAQMQSQAALLVSEQRYRALVETSPDAILLTDRDGTILLCNEQSARLYGHTGVEELLWKNLFALIMPDDHSRVTDHLHQIKTARQAHHLEYSMRTQAGTLFPAEVSVSALIDTDEQATGLIVVVRDITTRKHAEEALRDSEERYRSLVEQSPEPIAVHRDGEFVYVNSATAQLLGATSPNDLIGTPILDIIHPAYRDQVQARVRRVQEERLPSPLLEQKVVGLDGRIIDVEVTGIPITDAGQPATQVIMRDITARKQVEKQTQRQLQRLAALRSIDMAITASLDLPNTLNVVLDQAISQLHVDAAAVLLLNSHTQILEYAAGRGFRSHMLEYTRLRVGEGHAGRATLEGHLLHIPNLTAVDDFVRAPLLAGEDFVTYYGMPLTAKGQAKGVLEIFHRAPLEPDQEWLDFLEVLAGQAAIAIDNASLLDDLQRSNVELKLAYDTTIESWSRTLDLRDKETEGHSQRVTALTLDLARAMDMNDEELVHIRRGALLHDIGKMGVPDAILLKPGPLTDEEWTIMRRHPVYANELLAPIAFLRPALDIPYCHHEKWDGSGYPRGLQGEQIPLGARIFALVDVWDAMRSDRPYRKAWPEEQVRQHIQSLAGSHFDPRVVQVFLDLDV